jgi:hypothetical protein
MPLSININKVNSNILSAIAQLIRIQHSAEDYVGSPDADNAEALVENMERFANYHDGLKLNLAVMIKEANGESEDEVVGIQTDNGILLS